MELVYLWVENYKNIHEQGFNFSPRFNCHYDGKTLTINENNEDEYIKNIFTKNINISVIVGKNGSGKSRVLECLDLIYLKKTTFNYMLVYKKDDSDALCYISNIERFRDIILKYPFQNIKTHIYSSDRTFTFRNSISLEEKDILQYLLNSTFKNNFKLTTFMYFPNKLSVEPINLNDKFNKILEYDYSDYIYDDTIGDDENRRVMYGEEDIHGNLREVTDSYHQLLIILFLYEQEAVEGLNDKSTLLNRLNESDIKYPSESDFNTIFKIEIKNKIDELTPKQKEIYLSYYDFFEFNFIDSENRSYNNLSHGEKTLFGQFLSYYHLVNEQNLHIFLLDEPELSLHPKWQKQYIYELYNLSKNLAKKIHFIITSHSPFLLSDLPKSNIIFLDTYKKDEDDNQKEGNCKVVNGLIEKEQTFGANIHTLLSDSFFMEGGLMGEFAKQKINEIIKNLKDENYNPIEQEKEQISLIIESIGEKFLSSKMMEMYYRKFKDDALKKSRKKSLKSEIKRMQKELKQL